MIFLSEVSATLRLYLNQEWKKPIYDEMFLKFFHLKGLRFIFINF